MKFLLTLAASALFAVIAASALFAVILVGVSTDSHTYNSPTKLEPIDKKVIELSIQLEDLQKQIDSIKASIDAKKTTPSLPHPEDPVTCLANNIYYESGSEPIDGQIAVAQVTMNRVNNSNKTVCEVVYFKRINPNTNKKEAAFSWTLGAKWRAKGMNKRVYLNCVAIARAVLTNKLHSDIIDDQVEFYHANYISPSWKDKHVMVAQIGKHIFYK